MKKKLLIWTPVALIVIFALLQLTNPPRTNPPVVNDMLATNPPPMEVATLLRAACYDCHSSETKWPLYSKIAPISWQVADDVVEGRKNLNFSDWPTDPVRIAKRLENISDEIDNHEMPPPKYLLMHPEARLTDAQRKTIMDWTGATAGKLRSVAVSTNQ